MSLAFRSTMIVAVTSLLMLSSTVMSGQQPCSMVEFEYRSEGLRIRGEMARPSGPGPFPVVIWNHGDDRFREKGMIKFGPISDCESLTQKGWIYFFPDRRGAGRSEGPPPPWVDPAVPPNAVAQANEKWTEKTSHDILAGLKYLQALGFADLTRVAIVGYSGGADVTIYTAGAAPAAFRAVVVQAGGIPFAPERGLGFYVKWARPIKAPILLQYGRQDSLLPLGQAFNRALKGMGKDVTYLEYEGRHSLFGPMPRGVWAKDFIDFLTRRLSK